MDTEGWSISTQPKTSFGRPLRVEGMIENSSIATDSSSSSQETKMVRAKNKTRYFKMYRFFHNSVDLVRNN